LVGPLFGKGGAFSILLIAVASLPSCVLPLPLGSPKQIRFSFLKDFFNKRQQPVFELSNNARSLPVLF